MHIDINIYTHLYLLKMKNTDDIYMYSQSHLG